MKVAAVQMVSATSVEVNLAAARDLLTQAAAAGAELVVLPEYFCLLGRKDTDKLAFAENFGGGRLQDFLSRTARDLNIWLVGGTVPLTSSLTSSLTSLSTSPQPGKVFNSTLVYNPDGACIARYDKIHLFCFDNGSERYDESRVLVRGTEPVAFELPSIDGHTWRIGLSICYDLRFPELYRALNADVLLVPSAFTHTTGQAHWEVLLRARAIENLAFVVAPAQGGVHENGRRTWGHSMLVAPWGEVLGQHEEGPAVVMAGLHHPALVDARARLPALSHRVLA